MSFGMYNRFNNDTYSRVEKSTAEIISLEDMKLYLRVDDDTEDALIQSLIDAAIAAAERYMNRDLLEGTYVNLRDSLNQDLTLRRAGFLEFISFEYLKDGEYQEIDVDTIKGAPGGIYGKVWEVNIDDTYDDDPNAIRIAFKAGFGPTGSDIPADIVNALKAHVAYLYENRGDCVVNDVPGIAKMLYNGYRVIDINGVY